MKHRFTDKIALVSGGSRGIGEAIVTGLASEGAKVYFTYHNSQQKALDLQKRLSDQGFFAKALACDSTNYDMVQDVVGQVLDVEASLHILVNNSGVIRDNLFLSMSAQEWNEVMDNNLGGAFNFCKACVKPMMLARYGRIVNLSSISGDLGSYGQANYAASKGALNALTKSLASEFASRGVTVNAVAPGMVQTDMTEAVRGLLGDKIKEKIPVGRYAQADEIAQAVMYLASDAASYVTGVILAVDGGISLATRR